MLKILWKTGEIAPEGNLSSLLLSTIFCYLMLDSYVRFSLRDKPLFEITDVEITNVDCIIVKAHQVVHNIMPFRMKIKTSTMVCKCHRIIFLTSYLYCKNTRIANTPYSRKKVVLFSFIDCSF